MPDQSGRLAVVTGSNTGIGFQIARGLLRKGARVVIACRTLSKGEAARERLVAEFPGAEVSVDMLDLADLSSVASFADGFADAESGLDLLINNAGLMMPPFSKTADGFEIQIGTNHLGHFALTGRLLPLLLATPSSRVVAMSSVAHTWGDVVLDDLNWERRSYSTSKAYGASKLANLIFAYDLDSRLKAAGHGTVAVATHPGFTNTELQRNMGSWVGIFNVLLAMSAEQGSYSPLFAATEETIEGGEYIGPDRLLGWWGYPARSKSSKRSHDTELWAGLWKVSETLTGVSYL